MMRLTLGSDPQLPFVIVVMFGRIPSVIARLKSPDHAALIAAALGPSASQDSAPRIWLTSPPPVEVWRAWPPSGTRDPTQIVEIMHAAAVEGTD